MGRKTRKTPGCVCTRQARASKITLSHTHNQYKSSAMSRKMFKSGWQVCNVWPELCTVGLNAKEDKIWKHARPYNTVYGLSCVGVNDQASS